MQIDVRKPGIQVLLHKNIKRTTTSGSTPVSTRFSGQSSVVDLSPWLAEGHPVRVSKSVRAPAGTFSLTLADRMDPDVLDTLYSVIEPMDTVEIRMSTVGAGTGTDMPIMMRGFVSEVQREQGMTADGKPTRSVIVTGHDYGKILQIIQFFQTPYAPDTASAMITSFPWFTKYGDFSNILQADTFTQTLFDKVVNPYLAQMSAKAASAQAVMQMKTDISVASVQVSPFGIGTYTGGTVHSMIQSYGDIGPWNEFFIEDREDGPYAVYRPNPFIGPVSRDLLLSGASMPAVVNVDSRDIVSETVSRSDANVANYFWVDSARYLLNYGSTARALASASPDVYVTDYGNVDPTLYGVRKMRESTNQAGLDETDNGNGTPAGAPRNNNDEAALVWINQRRAELYMQNKDNVILESGSMRMKGRESIRAGRYLNIVHGQMASYRYVTSVTHDFTPFGNWFAEVQFERGTGFIDRIQQTNTNQAPYLSETVWKE